MQFLEKVPKKYSKNVVVAQFWQIILKVMPKWKLVRNLHKSKTPLNTPLSTWFFFCWVCIFWCFICILNIFEKKKFCKKFFFRRQFWRQFSVWRQFFLTSHAQKFPKMQFLERAPKKTSKNGVDAQIWQIISKVMPKWKFWVVDVNFWRQLHPKSQKYRTFPGETTILSFRTILLAHFRRI